MGDADKALAALTQAVKLGGNTQELNSEPGTGQPGCR